MSFLVLVPQRIRVKVPRKQHLDKFPRLFLSPRLIFYHGFTEIDWRKENKAAF